MAAPVKLTRWMRWRRSIACALIVALLLAFGLPALVASSALVALAVSSVDVVAATIVIVDTLAAIAVALGAQGAASSCARRLARRPGLVARGSGAWLQAVLGAIFLAALVSPVAAMDNPATTVYVAASLAMAAGARSCCRSHLRPQAGIGLQGKTCTTDKDRIHHSKTSSNAYDAPNTPPTTSNCYDSASSIRTRTASTSSLWRHL